MYLSWVARRTGNNAVAISNMLAMTALHDKGKLGDAVLIRTRRGVELPGTIVFHSFIPFQLSCSESPFSKFLSVNFGP